jgi:hypothetical protein
MHDDHHAMKKTSAPDKLERNWAKASRKRALLLRHLIELLRPHIATDPLLPELCDELASEAENQALPQVALEFAQIGHAAALQQFGPKHVQTRKARSYVRSLENVLSLR